MEVGEIKKRIQEHFTDGLVTIVGSGLSVASGLPGMEELAEHLVHVMKDRCPAEERKAWDAVADRLGGGTGLEDALKTIEVGDPIIEHIVEATAKFIETREKEVVRRVYSGKVCLPFESLLPYLSFNSERINVITINYDRLIELAAEMRGYGLNTLFPGQYHGELNPNLSKEALWTGKQTQKGKNIKRVYRKHVVVLKPHGSLDWFMYKGQPIRCTLPIEAPRLMITPGGGKYRMGYDQPFDRHRDAANRAIDSAARFLIIGYGFNDDQLETHLTPEIHKGKPCLILTKHLSGNGLKLAEKCKSILAICMGKDNGKEETKVICEGKEFCLPGSKIWNLENLIKEVLK